MVINNKQLSFEDCIRLKNYGEHLLQLPAEFLQEGENTVIIDFKSKFSQDCFGVSHVEIPVEDENIPNNRYVFGWNEIHGMHTCFPNFEQPSIRGRLK